jgi:hypothetical protein
MTDRLNAEPMTRMPNLDAERRGDDVPAELPGTRGRYRHGRTSPPPGESFRRWRTYRWQACGAVGDGLLAPSPVVEKPTMSRPVAAWWAEPRSSRRIRLAVRWAGAGAGLLLGSSLAAAQSCPCPTVDLAALVRQADVIFVGRSVSATTDSTPAIKDADDDWTGGIEFQTRLLFEVQSVLKGDPLPFAEVTTPTGPCGFAFAVGETYLVLGQKRGAAVSTDSCKGNVSGRDAIDGRAAAIRQVHRPSAMPP